MNYMLLFLSVLISQIIIHLYLGYFQGFGLSKIGIPNSITSDNTDLPKIKLATISYDRFILKRNLKHLEFINFLENHLNHKASEEISLEFLHEFKSMKEDVQLKIIEVTQKLS